MTDVLARVNKNSQNLLAEAICKLQGREWSAAHATPEPGSWAAGGLAIRDFLRRQNIDDSRYVLIDGSGLSRGNRVTARLLTDLLAAMSRHRYADEFRSSLSVSGKDGSCESDSPTSPSLPSAERPAASAACGRSAATSRRAAARR
jgi:D-alanyl-D-alanine carboxypeptidase/D-alanyl-D-alanine-endopeptidase (penicillin-binding protein 4)